MHIEEVPARSTCQPLDITTFGALKSHAVREWKKQRCDDPHADHLEYKPIDVMIPYSNLTRAAKTLKLYEKVGGSPSGSSYWGVKKKDHSKTKQSGGGKSSHSHFKSSSKKCSSKDKKAGGTGTSSGAVSTSSSS